MLTKGVTAFIRIAREVDSLAENSEMVRPGVCRARSNSPARHLERNFMKLPRAALLKAYRRMTEIRQFEERLHKENTTGDIPGFIHLYAGQEAIAVGVCEALLESDHIASTHRGHGHCIAKGCDIGGMMNEIFGRRSGLCHGKGGSMHIADLSVGMLGANAIVGGASPLAIGAALTHRYRNTHGVAVAFIGDGASNQGTTFEALNMAVILKLPVVLLSSAP